MTEQTDKTPPSLPGHGSRSAGRVIKWLLPPLLGVVVLGLGMALWGADDDQEAKDVRASTDFFRVSQGDFDLLVVASGELEAKRQVELKCLVKQVTAIVEIVSEGEQVNEGDVLVRLDDTVVRQKLEQAQLDLENERAARESAEENLRIVANENDSALRAAKVQVALTELALAQWREGDVPQQERELKLKLETAQRTLVQVRRDLDLSRQLYAEKFISLGELEDDEILVIEAENALASAQLAQEIYHKYTLPKDQQQFESNVAQAKADLNRTVQMNQSKLAQAQVSLNGKSKSLLIREQQLEDLQFELDNCVIRAPQSGLVVYSTSVGNARWRRDPMAVGRTVKYSEKLIVLPDTQQMVAALRVHEARLPQVHVGQPVSVTMDARPAEPMAGEVSAIGVMAESGGWMNPDLREYTVKVDLPPNLGEELKPAMRATGQILVGKVRDALAVPVQAVHSEGRTHYVHVPAAPGRVRKQPVTIGRASDTLVEITEGLHEGDLILLRQVRPGELSQS